jgi:hypothetical protein
MKMTKEQFANFRAEIEFALSEIAIKYGCIVEAGNIKYDDICTTVSVSFKTETAEKSADQYNFEMYCRKYGFGPTDYGFAFSHNGKFFKFVSFKTTARKYSCICDCSDGKQYAFTPEAIRVMMSAKAKGD